ncbi:hypothetical protein RUND412_003545 [Rhizina undulata]
MSFGSQSLYPTCSDPCYYVAIPSVCLATDSECLCDNTTFIKETSACVLEKCSSTDAQTVWSVASSACVTDGFVTSGWIALAEQSSSSSTSASTSIASAATSTAAAGPINSSSIFGSDSSVTNSASSESTSFATTSNSSSKKGPPIWVIIVASLASGFALALATGVLFFLLRNQQQKKKNQRHNSMNQAVPPAVNGNGGYYGQQPEKDLGQGQHQYYAPPQEADGREVVQQRVELEEIGHR